MHALPRRCSSRSPSCGCLASPTRARSCGSTQRILPMLKARCSFCLRSSSACSSRSGPQRSCRAAGPDACSLRRYSRRYRSSSAAAFSCSPCTPASRPSCATCVPGRCSAPSSSLPRWLTLLRHSVEALVALAAALLLTLVIAAPVVRAPSERIFGAEIVGRHHDPFTVMQQFERPARLGPYSQPVTDLTGAAIAHVTGAVAAYNWLVLLSFPLSAAAAYLLARHLALPAGAALF